MWDIMYLKHSLIKQHGILSEVESYGIINFKLFQIILEYYINITILEWNIVEKYIYHFLNF